MEPMKPMAPMEPMKPMSFDPPWWPEELGHPSTSGAQNDMRYAFFPDKRRLLIERGGKRTTYDTGSHRIGGVSQQGSHDHSVAFTSQHGPVRLDDLDVVDPSGIEPPASRHQGGQRQEHSQGGPYRAEQQRHDSHRGETSGSDAPRPAPDSGPGGHHDASPPRTSASSQDLTSSKDLAPSKDLASPKGGTPSGERVVFTEEGGPSRTLKLIASGDIDVDMLEALEDFIKRQKRRLAKG